MKLTTMRHIAVASVFAGVIAVSLGAAWLVGLYPSQEQRCTEECLAKGMVGSLEYVYPAAQTAGMRSRGPLECRCKPR